MQMTDSQDSRNVPRNFEDVRISGFQFQGKIDYLECMDKVVEILRLQNKKLLEENPERRDRRDNRDSRDSRDSRNSRDNSRRYRSDTDSSSEDNRYRSRSRDSSRSRSKSRGRTSINCTYCHKPNHDVSHCYKMVKDMKKLFSGELKIDEIKDQGRRASIQMLIDMENYY